MSNQRRFVDFQERKSSRQTLIKTVTVIAVHKKSVSFAASSKRDLRWTQLQLIMQSEDCRKLKSSSKAARKENVRCKVWIFPLLLIPSFWFQFNLIQWYLLTILRNMPPRLYPIFRKTCDESRSMGIPNWILWHGFDWRYIKRLEWSEKISYLEWMLNQIDTSL